MKKKLITLFVLIVTNLNLFFVNALSESDIDPERSNADSIISISWDSSASSILNKIFDKIIDYVFSLIALIIIGVLIYTWYLFITSSWDEAQFKKAWKTFIYAVIWIIIILLSWSVVKLVTTLWI